MRRRSLTAAVVVAAIVTIGTASQTVRAGGYWNMPGTLSQRAGHGYSGGYHAPFLLGPIKLDGWGAPNEVRLPCSPAPICGCATGCECYRMTDEPSMMEGAVPTPQTAARPVSATKASPAQPIFPAPVQR